MSRTLVLRHRTVPFLVGSYRYSRGLTLLELLVSMAIIAILGTFGVSNFGYWVERGRVDTLAMSLRTDLMFARSEAIKRGQSVQLCRQDVVEGQCAGRSGSGTILWQQGWLVFVDADRDRVLDASSGDRLLRTYGPLAAPLLLKWNRGDYIAYGAVGRLNSHNGTFCVGVNGSGTGLETELIVPRTGRLRTAAVTCRYKLP